MISRCFRRAILCAATTTILVGEQILAKTVIAQAQQTLPPVAPLRWVGYSGKPPATYPDAVTACKKEYELLDAGYSSTTLKRIELYKVEGYIQSVKCWMQWGEGGVEAPLAVDAICPNQYTYINYTAETALKDAKAGAGERIMKGKIKDPRYPEDEFAKKQYVYRNTKDGKPVVIHYWENLKTGAREGFKFKNP